MVTKDPNGNQTSKAVGTGAAAVTTRYVYDPRDKLVEAQQAPDLTSPPTSILGRFQYDFDGRRTKKIGEEGLRQYVYDQTSLLAEYDSAGLQKAKYDYGSDRLISLTRTDEGRRYFSLDGLRSVVNLTDDSGSTVASYHLDAWGSFRFPTELTASANRFAFTGHVFDTETGLYNARARYFDPKLGRFLTQDSFLGQIDEPPSLHRYLYAEDNPARFVDPTGYGNDDINLPPDPLTAFREDVEATGRGFVRGATGATRDAAIGTATTATRLVSTMTPPQQRFPVEMQEAVPELRPFGQADVDAFKSDVKFTVDTLRNIHETGPAALDAIAELGPEASGNVVGGLTVNTVATVEGGRGLVRGGFGALRAAPGELGEVGGNLADMFRRPSGPGAGILVESGATGPVYPVGAHLPDGRIAGAGPGAALSDGPEFGSIEPRVHGVNLLDPKAKTPPAATLAEWLKDHPVLLDKARQRFAADPRWHGVDPQSAPVSYRPSAAVERIRAMPGERGGHHPHGLALGGRRGQALTPTGDTRTSINPAHIEATTLQRQILRVIKEEMAKQAGSK